MTEKDEPRKCPGGSSGSSGCTGLPAEEPHECPAAIELDDDYEARCDCCDPCWTYCAECV